MEHPAPDDPATFDNPLDNATHHIADWRIVRGQFAAAGTDSAPSSVPIPGLMQAAESISTHPRIVVSPELERFAVRGVKVDINEVALAVATGYDLFPELHTPVNSDHEAALLPGERDGFVPLPEVDFFDNLSFCERSEILEDGDATSSFVIDQEGLTSRLLERPLNNSVFNSSGLDAALSPDDAHLAGFGKKKRPKPNRCIEGVPDTDPGSSCPGADPPKRKRRPRRCQNRIVVNGETIVCGLIDCPGRGGQKFCKNFSNDVKQHQQPVRQAPLPLTTEGHPFSLSSPGQKQAGNERKLSTLATLIRPVRDSELVAVAMEALQSLT